MSDATQQPGFVSRLIAFALRRRIVRAFLLYQEHRGPMLADSITYRALFSLFAAVFLGFSVAALWLLANPAAFDALIETLDRLIPGLIGADGAVDPAELLQPVEFSVAGAIALLGLVGAAIGAVGSMRHALRRIADAPTDSTFFIWVLLQQLGVALLLGVALVVAAGLTVFGTSAVAWVLTTLGLGDAGFVTVGVDLISIGIIVALDVLVVAVLLRVLPGLRPSASALWSSALIGGLALAALQLLSGLIVGGAMGNPLLASFASLITLLLWLNFSSQAILITGAWLATSVAEEHDRVRARFGASSFDQRRVQRAEDGVLVATRELDAARAAQAELKEAKRAKAEAKAAKAKAKAEAKAKA